MTRHIRVQRLYQHHGRFGRKDHEHEGVSVSRWVTCSNVKSERNAMSQIH